MTTPAPGAQIAIGAEKFEEILCRALVDKEVRAKPGVEALNGTGGRVALLQQPLEPGQEGVGLGAEQCFEPRNDTGSP